mmetsp:Transcript_25920/g.83968  ORF Transcript_25920/g.83968 Transcript_25920/m.83968 type:complete len:185 (+) Transcript_25920:85-639(+)
MWCCLLLLSVSALRPSSVPCPSRRRSLEMGAAGLGGGWLKPTLVAAGKTSPLVDVPLRRLRLPRGGFGRDYVLVGIELEGQKEEFLLDTGLSVELVTPKLREQLHLGASGVSVEGATAGGTGAYEVVELKGARVEGIELPLLHSTVADFPMEHIDPKHDVTGMLGLSSSVLLVLFFGVIRFDLT